MSLSCANLFFFFRYTFLQRLFWGIQQMLSEVINIQLNSFFRKAFIRLIFQASVAQRIPWKQRLHFRGIRWRAKRQLIPRQRSLSSNGTQRMDGATHRTNHCPVGLQSLLDDPHDGSLGDYFLQCLLWVYWSCNKSLDLLLVPENRLLC